MNIRRITMARLKIFVICFCSTFLLAGCKVNRPKYGGVITKEFDSYDSFNEYLKKQDSVKKTETYPLFDCRLENSISAKFFVEGIDVTGNYKNNISEQDYNNFDFVIMMHRQVYIASYFDDNNFVVVGFEAQKDINKIASPQEYIWAEIYGDLFEKYGEGADKGISGYYEESLSNERTFFMYEYISEVKYGLSLRNEDGTTIAYMFTNADSFDYLNCYKNFVINGVNEVLKHD